MWALPSSDPAPLPRPRRDGVPLSRDVPNESSSDAEFSNSANASSGSRSEKLVLRLPLPALWSRSVNVLWKLLSGSPRRCCSSVRSRSCSCCCCCWRCLVARRDARACAHGSPCRACAHCRRSAHAHPRHLFLAARTVGLGTPAVVVRTATASGAPPLTQAACRHCHPLHHTCSTSYSATINTVTTNSTTSLHCHHPTVSPPPPAAPVAPSLPSSADGVKPQCMREHGRSPHKTALSLRRQ